MSRGLGLNKITLSNQQVKDINDFLELEIASVDADLSPKLTTGFSFQGKKFADRQTSMNHMIYGSMNTHPVETSQKKKASEGSQSPRVSDQAKKLKARILSLESRLASDRKNAKFRVKHKTQLKKVDDGSQIFQNQRISNCVQDVIYKGKRVAKKAELSFD